MRIVCTALVLGLLVVGVRAVAGERCTYDGQFYGQGATVCQNGEQARCVDGRWEMTGLECSATTDDDSQEEQPGVVQPPVGSD